MLPTKFQVRWPFGSGVEAKNRFSRWRPWQPSWISGTILAIFDLQVTPTLPTKIAVMAAVLEIYFALLLNQKDNLSGNPESITGPLVSL